MSQSPSLSLLGVFNVDALARAASAPRSYLVDNLLFEGSVNLAVGDSGLGKTALLASLGVAVAAGVPWLGRSTSQGPVLFIDGESPLPEFSSMLRSLSQYAGLSNPPDDFLVWSPQWDERPAAMLASRPADDIAKQVQAIKPKLVIVDPLRVFWPAAETKSEEAIAMIQRQRELSRETGTAWVTLHHRRKTNVLNQVNLETDSAGWFQEAAGARALINQTDTRIGIDKSSNPHAALVVGGFTRMIGAIPPIHVERLFDDDGTPLGYRPLSGFDHLPARYRQAYGQLGTEFRYKEAKLALGGTSDATTADFLTTCQTIGLVRAEGLHRTRRYLKIMEQLE